MCFPIKFKIISHNSIKQPQHINSALQCNACSIRPDLRLFSNSFFASVLLNLEKVIPLKSFFENISEEDLSTYPSEIFLIEDFNSTESSNKRKQKGALVLCKDDIKLISNFNTMLGWDLDDYKSWTLLLKDKSPEERNQRDTKREHCRPQ